MDCHKPPYFGATIDATTTVMSSIFPPVKRPRTILPSPILSLRIFSHHGRSSLKAHAIAQWKAVSHVKRKQPARAAASPTPLQSLRLSTATRNSGPSHAFAPALQGSPPAPLDCHPGIMNGGSGRGTGRGGVGGFPCLFLHQLHHFPVEHIVPQPVGPCTHHTASVP